MNRLLISIILFYQRYLSSLLPYRCKFYPSCSEYTKEAIIKKGIFRGILLGIHRIIRCNPVSKGGYDPVK